MRGDEVCALSDAVYDVHDRVVAVRFGQFHHEVDANDIPLFFGGFRGVEFSRRALALRFCVIAELAGFDVAADVSQHLRPPVVPRNSAPKVQFRTDPNSVQTGTEPPVSVSVPHLAEPNPEVRLPVSLSGGLPEPSQTRFEPQTDTCIWVGTSYFFSCI